MDLSGILADTPWLRPALVTVLGGCLLWLLASIPARWVLLLFTPLTRHIAAWVERVRASMAELRLARRAAIQATRQELLSESRHVIDVTAATTWRSAVESARAGLGTAVEALQSNRNELRHATVAIEKAQKRFARLDRAAQLIPNIGGGEDLGRHLQAHRAASLRLYGSLLFAIPVAFANSLLSSRVLTELGLSAQSVFGARLPLSYVVAVMLVLTEMAIGWLHGMSRDRDQGDERRLTAGEIGWTIAGLGIIALETALYSLVVPAELAAVFSIPGVPKGSAFALLGAILGAAVFGLGTAIYSALALRRRSLTPRALNRDLRRLNRSADDWNSLVTQLTAKQSQLGALIEKSQTLGSEQSDVSAAVEKLQSQFERHAVYTPEWARPSERAVAVSDIRERESRCSVWVSVSGCVIAAGTVVWALSAGLVSWPAVGIGAGCALLFYGSGLVLGHTIAPWVAHEATTRAELRWSSRATMVAALTPLALPLVTFVVLAIVVPPYRLLWGLSIPLAVLLVIAGRETGSLLVLIPVEVAKLKAAALTLFELMLLSVARLVYVFVLLIQGILYVLAAPILSIWPIRSASAPVPLPSEAVTIRG